MLTWFSEAFARGCGGACVPEFALALMLRAFGLLWLAYFSVGLVWFCFNFCVGLVFVFACALLSFCFIFLRGFGFRFCLCFACVWFALFLRCFDPFFCVILLDSFLHAILRVRFSVV